MAIAPRAEVSIGDLKHLAEIQRLIVGKDEFGFQQEALATIAKVRCKVDFDDRLMREIFKDNGVDTSMVAIFTFRYFDGVTVKDKILYKGNLHEIYGVQNLNEENRFLRVWGRRVT